MHLLLCCTAQLLMLPSFFLQEKSWKTGVSASDWLLEAARNGCNRTICMKWNKQIN